MANPTRATPSSTPEPTDEAETSGSSSSLVRAPQAAEPNSDMTSYTHTLTSTRLSGEGGRYYSNQVGASISCIASLAGFVLVNEIGPTSKGKVIEYKTLHLRNMPDVPVVAPADAGGGDDGDGEGNRGRTEARNDPNEPNKLLSPYKPEVYTPVISDSSGYASSEITWNRSAPNTVNTNATSQWYTNSSSRAPTFTEESKTDREQFSPDSGVVPGASISRSEPIPVFFGSGVGRGAEVQVYASSSSAVDSSLSTTVNTNAGIRSRSASDPASSQICTVASCSDQERVRSSSFPNPYTFSTDASSPTSLGLTAQAAMPTTVRDMVYFSVYFMGSRLTSINSLDSELVNNRETFSQIE